MSDAIFNTMLSRYQVNTKDDLINATHEVMQQIVLAGLYRSDFFDKAAFYGGTCLRIFHGLDRFSEDMDFSLLKSNDNFKLEDYFEYIIDEFRAVGKDIVINKKRKTAQTNIESAFLKENTDIYDLQFTTEKKIKIKIEVDTYPPAGFDTEFKLLLLPFSFMTRCYTLPDLYAGKMHAFLFRNWKNRVKGRDWYDFEFYVRNNTPLNLNHLKQRIDQTNKLEQEELTLEIFKQMLRERIQSTNINLVKNDVRPFLRNPQDIDIWSMEYFLELVEMVRVI